MHQIMKFQGRITHRVVFLFFAFIAFLNQDKRLEQKFVPCSIEKVGGGVGVDVVDDVGGGGGGA